MCQVSSFVCHTHHMKCGRCVHVHWFIAISTDVLLTRISILSYCLVTLLQQHPVTLCRHVWRSEMHVTVPYILALLPRNSKLLRLPCKTCHTCASDVSWFLTWHFRITCGRCTVLISTHLFFFFCLFVTPKWAAAPESHNLCGKTCAYLPKGRRVCVCHTLYNAPSL